MASRRKTISKKMVAACKEAKFYFAVTVSRDGHVQTFADVEKARESDDLWEGCVADIADSASQILTSAQKFKVQVDEGVAQSALVQAAKEQRSRELSQA